MTWLSIPLAIVFATIGVKCDDEIRNTRFPLCVKELLKMAPPDLIKDIEFQSPSYDKPCYFGVHNSEALLNREISPGLYAFDFDLAKKMCDLFGATIPTIRDRQGLRDSNLPEGEPLWEQVNYHYALAAEMEFIRNDYEEKKSIWKIKKWGDGQSSYLRGKEIKGAHIADSMDIGILVHEASASENIDFLYQVIVSRVGFPHKISLRCQQDIEKMLTSLKSPEPPVTPEPGPSVRNVNICDKTSRTKHLPNELLDRIESSIQLQVIDNEPNRCYFQLDQQTTDKANFEFQKGFYRFSFQYARITCETYGAQLLSFDTQAELKNLAKQYEHWKTEEFYAIGATVGKPKLDENKVISAFGHKVRYQQIDLDKVGDYSKFGSPWGKNGIIGFYHPDEKDVAGLVFSQNFGITDGWFILQNSVGFYKPVRVICVQNLNKLNLRDPGTHKPTPLYVKNPEVTTSSRAGGDFDFLPVIVIAVAKVIV